MVQLRDHLGPAVGVKQINRKRVLLAVMIKADTQAGLSRRTSLSGGTVSAIVREMASEGTLLVEKNENGARGSLVRLCRTSSVAVGVHIGFNHTRVVARRLDQGFDDLHPGASSESGANSGLERVLPDIRRMVDEAVRHVGGSRESDIISLGVAVPRMIDPRTGGFTTPVLPPWHANDDLVGRLRKTLGLTTVVLDNDANLGALAEQTFGTDEGLETVVYVKVSTGVGAGLIIGNSMVRGHRGMAGEIGHSVMDPRGAVCRCGGRGCLETVIGADSLVRQVRDALTGSSVDLPDSLRSVIDRAHANDVVCVRVLEDAGRHLGQALAQVCNMLNPNLIVLGGRLEAASDLVLGPCKESLLRYSLRGAADAVLRKSSLGQLTEAHGALVLGLRSYDRDGEAQAAAV
ncbi:ROK family protein [Streptomyces sp. NP-1717]|uniref:ROK family protein n=1 Tax=unclassified Streptomyces TaxID=2593676 RepID=UPI001F5C14B9|nr:ROK family protein [Streptomyces sp. NP-1717]MCI3226186.1 ROK family protein [Streptomyces sp. NP-1717]WTA77949.1 ROK family protein [Streptomyces sp. NBC_00838]